MLTGFVTSVELFLGKPVWADNGDDISIQYSGTPALKGDFVRYIFLLALAK